MTFSVWLPALLVACSIFSAAANKVQQKDAPTTGLRANAFSNQGERKTNTVTPDYWVAPIKNAGLTCIDNSIRAGGGKPNEICMTEGEALCVEYDYKPMGGRWQFGIKDSRLRLYDPRGDVVWEYCRDVTHLCIGEEQGFVPNRYSKERPYMTLYDEKTHEVVGSLTCDGTDGKSGQNLGQSTILKLVDQVDVGLYADYPLTIVKFRKGQTEDPEDDNSLLNIEYNPNEPQRLWWENLADFDATFSYNQGKCEWTDLCPTNTPSSAPSVSFVPTTFCDNGERVGTFRELKEVIDEATDPDPANRAKIEICPDEPIVFDSIVDISDKYFEIECHESSECVLDLNGYSFVTPKPSFGTGSKFYAGFESIIIENGSTDKGRDGSNYGRSGGAFSLYGADPISALTIKKCTFRNNVASQFGGAVFTRENTLNVTNSNFTANVANWDGGAVSCDDTNFGAFGYASFSNCRFERNTASDSGGAVYVLYNTAVFDDCNFIENTAGYGGGAISVEYGGSISNCNFEKNSARKNGGAIYSSSFNFVLKDSRFISNNATGNGGAIEMGGFRGSSETSNCLFERNTAGGDGGAFSVYRANEAEMTNCTFQSNTATLKGGAGHVSESPRSSSIGGNLIAVDCKFLANSARIGGALATFWNTTLQDCQFKGNRADAAGAILSHPEKVGPYKGQRTLISGADALFKCNAAATSSGGAIQHFGGKFEMSDAEIVANEARVLGGGIQFQNADVVLKNCRLEQNSLVKNAGQSGGGGGGIALSGTNITMENTVFQGNSIGMDDEGQDIYVLSPPNNVFQCGAGDDNCFCDADDDEDLNITTNYLPTTCAGSGVGPTCTRCSPTTAPIVCPLGSEGYL